MKRDHNETRVAEDNYGLKDVSGWSLKDTILG